jgi:transcription factor IIIB subunit 2
LACSKCGRVYEDAPIVSEVTFGETSNGAAVVQGSFVGADQAHATFATGPRGNSMDSRAKTLVSAKRKIRAVSNALRIPEYVSDAAYQWFSLALANNFVKGRRSQNVIAACLYIACRKEKTHHMLIDFSARLQISVFSVGATFLKMVKVLHITSLPLADPSLFIQHFAEKLEFGDDKVKIVKDAVRLAQRMSDDWIHEGRRPAGVAGACLLLAARMNNHRRTHAEIVAVAHVGEDTLQRRLNEFKETHSAKLTVREFREAENIPVSNPPSFKRNRVRESEMVIDLKKRQEKSDLDDLQELEDTNELKLLIGKVDLDSQEILDQLERVKKRQKQDMKRIISTNNIKLDEQEEGETQQADEIEDPDRPKNLHKLPTTAQVLENVSSSVDNFDDISDAEIDGFLLTEEESLLKERVWTGLNEDFLLEQEQKRLKAEADEISGHQQPRKKKKTIKSEADALNDLEGDGIQGALKNIGEASSASMAARNMLSKKAQSKKINYLALNNLFEQ